MHSVMGKIFSGGVRMNVIDLRRIRDDKINKMMQGQSVYAETSEMIRLLNRAIKRQSLNVRVDYANGGYWFMLKEND